MNKYPLRFWCFSLLSNSNTHLWNERTTLKWIEWNTLFKLLLHLNIFTFRRHSWSKYSSYGTYWKKSSIYTKLSFIVIKWRKCNFALRLWSPYRLKTNQNKQTKKQATLSICFSSFLCFHLMIYLSNLIGEKECVLRINSMLTSRRQLSLTLQSSCSIALDKQHYFLCLSLIFWIPLGGLFQCDLHIWVNVTWLQHSHFIIYHIKA